MIRTVAERMKAIGDTVTISANLRGQFQLRVETDAASVQTEWRGLTIPEMRPSLFVMIALTSQTLRLRRRPHPRRQRAIPIGSGTSPLTSRA